jgi:hypothetical protein
MKRLENIIFITGILFCQVVANAQGGVKATALHSADGFPGDQILQVFNEMPFVKSKDGFTVEAKYRLNSNLVMGVKRGYVDFLFQEKFSYTPLFHISMTTNDFSFLARGQLFDQETTRFHFPDFYRDTIVLSWTDQNGIVVGQPNDPKRISASNHFFLLNPKAKPFFNSVTQEEYIRFLLALIQDHIDQRQKHLNEHAARNGAPPPGVDPSNEKVMAMIAQNLKADSLWVDYYRRRMKEYTTLLTSMTAAEKKQAAFAITPKFMASEKDKHGQLKDIIEGGMPFELLRNKEEASVIIPLYEFNSSFFDPHLSPGAIQLMVFREISVPGKPSDAALKIKDQFFTGSNFKAFEGVMYK